MTNNQPQTNTPIPPRAPPPSLAYPRSDLIAIARASPSLTYPPLLEHLASLPELVRPHAHSLDSLLDDDTHSIPLTLLAEDPPALIEGFRIVTPESDPKDTHLPFDFGSLDLKPPVLINFADPFSSIGGNVGGRRASDAFQQTSSFPPLVRSSSGASDTSSRAIRLGDSFAAVREDKSRSSSISSSFSSSPVMRKGSLSPWAAPYPLPATTPALAKTPAQAETVPSLPMPLPKVLPSTLPARPQFFPPVFVKKEAAILPQSMALPTVKPMGPEWADEANISGNELRRRRASEMGSLPMIRTAGSMSVAATPKSIPGPISQSMGEPRPAHLVKLGQSLRQSIAAKGQKA